MTLTRYMQTAAKTPWPASHSATSLPSYGASPAYPPPGQTTTAVPVGVVPAAGGYSTSVGVWASVSAVARGARCGHSFSTAPVVGRVAGRVAGRVVGTAASVGINMRTVQVRIEWCRTTGGITEIRPAWQTSSGPAGSDGAADRPALWRPPW